MNNLKEEIKGFIFSTFPMARKKSITYEDSLLESGIIDSLGILEVVNYLVENHEIDVDEDDLIPDNFNTIQSMVDFIQRKRNGKGLSLTTKENQICNI